MKYWIALSLMTMLVLAACEKTVTIDIPVKNPKLVVNAWLEADSLITLSVGRSRHILDPQSGSGSSSDNYRITDAVPVVYENNISIDTLVYSQQARLYISPRGKKIRLGFNYSIKVKAPGYEEVEASTIVPSRSQIGLLNRVRNARTDAQGYMQDEITLRIDDPAAEKNFYLIQFAPAYYWPGQGYGLGCVSTTDKDLESIGYNTDPFDPDNCYDGGSLLVKDANFNGRQKQFRFYISSDALQEQIGTGGRIMRPFVRVCRVTEEHFKFVKSYYIYNNTSENPFAEPVNVFSNVTRGYGIFSAYTAAVDTLR